MYIINMFYNKTAIYILCIYIKYNMIYKYIYIYIYIYIFSVEIIFVITKIINI